MGGNFQEHQGVEFNNPDGTPVQAIGDGVVVFAGPAERGANTVAIRHDRKLKGLFSFSTYYRNARLLISVGQRVKEGDVIALVGNTGRATNDHLHLEIHTAPVDSVPLIVDPNERYPKYTVNPELWIRPLPGTGIVAGRGGGAPGRPAPPGGGYGVVKAEPQGTPDSDARKERGEQQPGPGQPRHLPRAGGRAVLGRREAGGGRRSRAAISRLPSPASRGRADPPGAARSVRAGRLRRPARLRRAACGGTRGAHGRHPLCGRERTRRRGGAPGAELARLRGDRKSTRLNSSHLVISYAVFCLKKKNSDHSVGGPRQPRPARPDPTN